MSMKDEQNQKCQNGDEDELDEQHKENFHPLLPIGEHEEEDYVNQLDQGSGRVNSDH